MLSSDGALSAHELGVLFPSVMSIFRTFVSSTRPRSTTSAVFAQLAGVALLLLGTIGDAAAAPKYFIKVRDTELAAGIDTQVPQNGTAPSNPTAADKPDGGAAVVVPPTETGAKAVADMVKGVLTETLRKQPEVTLELESPLSNGDAVKAECKRKGLRAFEFAVRVLKMSRTIKPPAAGKRFRNLEQIVKLSVVGTTIPEGLLAVGGDGESTIQIEVGERITPGQEREVLEESLKDAVEQAVKQGMLKLSQPVGKPAPEKRRKK